MNNQTSSQSPKLPFFYRHLPILLGVIIVIMVAGGILAWQYFGEVEKLDIEEEVKILTEEEIKTEEKIEELEKKEGWLRVFNYQADVNNDGIDEFFVIEKSRKETPPYRRAYDVVALFNDREKLVEVWRKQVVLWKRSVEHINVSVGDLDKNGINEILIMLAGRVGEPGVGFLYEYNKDEVKFEQKSKFSEIIGRIMNRKPRDIKYFRHYWDFEGIGDYDQDGVNEILTRYYWIDEVTAGLGSIIPISWEEIKEEKRIMEEESLVILSPAKNEKLKAGEIYEIRWDAVGMHPEDRIRIRLIARPPVGEWIVPIDVITDDVLVNIERFSWRVPTKKEIEEKLGDRAIDRDRLAISIIRLPSPVSIAESGYFSIVEFVPEEEVVQKAIPFNVLDSDKKLSEYLIENTDLIEGTEFTFIRTEEFVAFFTFHPYRMVDRGIIQKKESGGFLVLLEDDPCYCLGLRNVYAKRLVHDWPEFVVSDFWPLTGTCVVVNPLRVSKISENRFKDIWEKDNFACRQGDVIFGEGARAGNWISDIATVEFKDLDNDNNLEIVRTGHTIKCGDMCCCKEGPKKSGSEFQQIFTWDKQLKNFVEK